MELAYYGTAAAEGWPGVFCECESCKKARNLGGKNIRTRSQAIVNDDLLIDFPPDTYMHSLYGTLNLRKVKALLITHAHTDHFYPEELIMYGEPYAHHSGAVVLDVYGNKPVKDWFASAMRLNDSSDLTKKLSFHEIAPFKPIQVLDYKVTPLLAAHDLSMQCCIYVIEQGNKRILYGNDTGIFPEETWDYIKGLRFNLVSLDCCSLMQPSGHAHMGLAENRIVKNRMRELGCVNEDTCFVVTHFSHNGNLTHEEIENTCADDRFTVAYDGMKVNI